MRVPGWRAKQNVLNEHWPAGPAWRIPRVDNPVAAAARIVWQRDGEEWLNGLAT